MIKNRKHGHIGLATTDIEADVKWYIDVLGFELIGDFKDEKFFILEMTYSGIVSLNVPKEHVEPVLMIEIPHMLFPYARQAVSNTLFNGGLPPLMLTPIDFVALYQARKQKQASAEPQPDK